jgi:hypothetical protein
MNSDEMFAKHGLVLVQAFDVRRMMDAYQRSEQKYKTELTDECYTRLWNAMESVGLVGLCSCPGPGVCSGSLIISRNREGFLEGCSTYSSP